VFKGQGYFRLLPQDRPATLEDVRRFALHSTESLKEQLEDPSAVLLPMATHRQGFRQKRRWVAAVMGHSPEVHRRTYLSEISGEQTKAAVVRRLLGDEQVAQEFAENPPEKPYFFLPERRSRSDWARFQCFRGSESLISGVSQMGG
jgi:hypothetical protein